jgi:hypothetical protein
MPLTGILGYIVRSSPGLAWIPGVVHGPAAKRTSLHPRLLGQIQVNPLKEKKQVGSLNSFQ